MKEFLEYLAKRLVDFPENVSVEIEEKDLKTIFKLKVAEGDVGKVIGRDGKTASALRVLLHAVSAKGGRKAILEIVDSSSRQSHVTTPQARL